MRDRPVVLFVCVHNAGRSQMAAGLLRKYADGAVDVRSAGTAPSEEINPSVVTAMSRGGRRPVRCRADAARHRGGRSGRRGRDHGLRRRVSRLPREALPRLGAPRPGRTSRRGGAADPRRDRRARSGAARASSSGKVPPLMGRLFGTDGVRGVAGTELTAGARHRPRPSRRGGARSTRRRTPRRSWWGVTRGPPVSGSRRRWSRASAGPAATSCSPGSQPTPAIAFMTVDLGASAGVVISASHNPAEDNGIKFFSREGMKLPDAVEDEIEAALDRPARRRSNRASVEPMRRGASGATSPTSRARRSRRSTACTWSSTARTGLPPTWRPRCCDVSVRRCTAIFAAPDGVNINDGCGALHPEVVAAEVVRLGADAGVSHDGDADRALFADATGEVIDGDQVLAACARRPARRGRARGRHRRRDRDGEPRVRTRDGARRHPASSDEGGRPVRARGDGASGVALGGEQSGHVIFRRATRRPATGC